MESVVNLVNTGLDEVCELWVMTVAARSLFDLLYLRCLCLAFLLLFAVPQFESLPQQSSSRPNRKPTKGIQGREEATAIVVKYAPKLSEMVEIYLTTCPGDIGHCLSNDFFM